MVLQDGGGNLAQNSGFAGLRWRNYEGTLAKAERHKEVHQAHGDGSWAGLQGNTAVGMDGSQFFEGGTRCWH